MRVLNDRYREYEKSACAGCFAGFEVYNVEGKRVHQTAPNDIPCTSLGPEEWAEMFLAEHAGELAQAKARVEVLEKERKALNECPNCGSKNNSLADGGNENCFHCECGFIQCGSRGGDSNYHRLKVERDRLAGELAQARAEIEHLKFIARERANPCVY